jgi:hypothetical protein
MTEKEALETKVIRITEKDILDKIERLTGKWLVGPRDVSGMRCVILLCSGEAPWSSWKNCFELKLRGFVTKEKKGQQTVFKDSYVIFDTYDLHWKFEILKNKKIINKYMPMLAKAMLARVHSPMV